MSSAFQRDVSGRRLRLFLRLLRAERETQIFQYTGRDLTVWKW
jgi:hypothetical protein